MSKRTLVDWLEISTSLAVLIGLVLVIMEIRVNTNAVNRQAAVDRSVALTEPFFYSEVIRSADEKVRAVDGSADYRVALADRYDLTQAESLAWSRHLMQLWVMIEGDYYNGEKAVALGFARTMLGAADSREFVRHWRFREDFQQEIDRILVETAQPDS
jgi:hypothetical protein